MGQVAEIESRFLRAHEDLDIDFSLRFSALLVLKMAVIFLLVTYNTKSFPILDMVVGIFVFNHMKRVTSYILCLLSHKYGLPYTHTYEFPQNNVGQELNMY